MDDGKNSSAKQARLLQNGYVLNSGKALYTIESVIGTGGYGATYKARTTVMLDNIRADVYVAIKELTVKEVAEEFMANAEALRMVAGLSNNMAGVNEVFQYGENTYCVMEFIDGVTLARYVKEHGRLALGETLRLMSPVVEAVAQIHDRKVTHLDIKPSNIMITSDGEGNPRPVLIDFDELRFYSDSVRSRAKGVATGCSDGFSPVEQYDGITSFSPTADVYSLGATVLFCLTGVRPPASYELQTDYPSMALSGLADVSTIRTLNRAMSARPADRQANAGELYWELTDATRPARPKNPIIPTPPVPAKSKSLPLWQKICLSIIPAILAGLVVWGMISIMNSSKSIDDGYPTIPDAEESQVAEETDVVSMPAMDEGESGQAAEVSVGNGPAVEEVRPGIPGPMMTTMNFSGYFEDGKGGRWPVKLKFTTDGQGRWGDCQYTNVNYGTTIKMNGSGSGDSYRFESANASSPLSIRVSYEGEGVWSGTATSGNTSLRCVLYE